MSDIVEIIDSMIENMSHPYGEEWDGGYCTGLLTLKEMIEGVH